MRISRAVRVLVTIAAVVSAYAVAPAPVCLAQDRDGTGQLDIERDLVLLRDFIHYARIDQRDLARSNAQALLDRGLDPQDILALVEDSGEVQRFEETVLRAQRVPQLEDVAARLLRMYEQGHLERARAASEISRNIGFLTGTQRQRLLARERLVTAGEYATPQLLEALLQRRDSQLSAQVAQVFVDMGRQAVIPLGTALPDLDPSSQELVVPILGNIPYRTSLPFLYELHRTTGVNEVRRACERAITRITGSFSPGRNLAGLYEGLAELYYNESATVTSFPGEDQQLLWSFNPGVGLFATPIRTEVFHEAMAMRFTEHALRLDENYMPALALWIAANFSRELNTPAGYDNPAYGAERRDAMYYAVASGSAVVERVLARAIDDRHTMLARRAIAAIERTAGGAGLWTGTAERRPLLEALRYPNRRVQYEAAMALGAAKPREEFQGSDRVVPILASAIRDAGARYAVVVAADAERQQSLADVLRRRGFTVVASVRRLADGEQAIAEAPGIDLVLSDLPTDSTSRLIDEVRGRARLGATPVLALASLQGWRDLSARYQRDGATRIVRSGVSDDEIASASEQLLEASVGGPITEREARGYKVRSLSVLRDLAVSGNPVLNVSDAARPLVGAMAEERGEILEQIAEVLSHIGTPRVQTALMDRALGASGADRVMLLNKTASSARRFGNMLEDRHVRRLVEIAVDGADEEATAAAALMGALNLPNRELIPLILGDR